MDHWHDNLLKEYKAGRKKLRQKIKSLDKEDEADKVDIKIINSMINEMTFVIEWLETGVIPQSSSNKYRAYTYKDKFVYGADGYWDDSVGGIVDINAYSNPFLEVEEKIDRELEGKRNVKTS